MMFSRICFYASKTDKNFVKKRSEAQTALGIRGKMFTCKTTFPFVRVYAYGSTINTGSQRSKCLPVKQLLPL